MAPDPEIERITRERDLYRRLLYLADQPALEELLEEALGLVVEVTGARHGYLELLADDPGGEPRSWTSTGCSDEKVADIRTVISRGIVARTIADGRTVLTESALADPRFDMRESVRLGKIEAVLCAPIGSDPPFGVLYLERPAEDAAWTEEARDAAELVSQHMAPFVDRILARERSGQDAVSTLRDAMRLDGIVGHSRSLADALEQARLVAPLEVNVLLTGESGTGKTQLARVIHENGPRAGRPFVEFNCATLQETLVESELFGAKAGSHSTAQRDTPGKVAAAEGGTLFLDEIGEITPAIQAKLLQLIQSREYFPLGANEPVRADVRVIAATNTDLEAAVAEKRFREDLYYRLQVLPIRLPSLRERREDIPDLAIHLLDQAMQRHGLPRIPASLGALRALEAAEWPGNVRQLANTLEAAAIRAAGERATQIERAHLFPTGADAAVPADDGPLTFQAATRQFQGELLRKTLEETDWNVSETARRLDLARSHVYNLIHAFQLARD